MKLASLTRSVSMLAVFSLIPPAFAVTDSHQAKAPEEAIQLIRQIEDVARDVRNDVATLKSFTNSVLVSRTSHAHQLQRIKSLVNESMRPALARLAEIQPQLPEWKQQSVEKMLAAATTLAADTSAAFVAKSESRSVAPLNMEYKALVARMYAHSEDLVKTSDAAGTYAMARGKAVKAGLDVPRS